MQKDSLVSDDLVSCTLKMEGGVQPDWSRFEEAGMFGKDNSLKSIWISRFMEFPASPRNENSVGKRGNHK